MSDAKEQSERERAFEHLRILLKPRDSVYTILRHVSRSGMMRSISPLIIKDNEIYDLTYWASQILGWKIHKNHYGIKVDGCGMDMGFHLVYSLSRYLFPDGFGEKCLDCDFRFNSKEESEQYHRLFDCISAPSRTHIHRFRGRNADSSGWDNDGGYALQQRWL